MLREGIRTCTSVTQRTEPLTPMKTFGTLRSHFSSTKLGFQKGVCVIVAHSSTLFLAVYCSLHLEIIEIREFKYVPGIKQL